MAIVEKSTNNYYKIDFDNCMIKGLSVIVAFSTYLSTEDRNKEKERRPLITAFLNAVQQTVGTKYEQLMGMVAEYGISAESDIDGGGVIKGSGNAGAGALEGEVEKRSNMRNQGGEGGDREGDK